MLQCAGKQGERKSLSLFLQIDLTEALNSVSEGAVEGDVGRGEVDVLGELAGFAGTLVAVHAHVFPFDGKRAAVTDVVQGADDFFEPYAATTDAAEVPATTLIAKWQMAGENSGATVEGDGGVFHVRVINTIGEVPNELDGIDALPDEVAGVKVEAELFAIVEGLERRFRGVDIKCDFGGMDFQRELDAAFLEDVENRVPAVGEQLVTGVVHFPWRGGEIVEQMPDAGTGEAVDHADAELLSGAGGVLHFFDGAFVDAGGIAVTPDVFGENGFVALVDVIEDGLTDEVIGNREELQVVFFQEFPFAVAVGVVGQCFVDFEMISPAGQFQAVIAEVLCFFAHLFQGEVGPLSGE